MEVNPCDHRRQPGPLPRLDAGVLEHQTGTDHGDEQHGQAPRRARASEPAPAARGQKHAVTCTHRLSQHPTDQGAVMSDFTRGRCTIFTGRTVIVHRVESPITQQDVGARFPVRAARRTRRARRRAGALAPGRGSPPRPRSRGRRLRPAGQASRAWCNGARQFPVCVHTECRVIGTNGSSVCWIDHKTIPFDNLYQRKEMESRKSHPKGREIVEKL
jgi:hypothetical protein